MTQAFLTDSIPKFLSLPVDMKLNLIDLFNTLELERLLFLN